ncbi:MAG: 16S rRNA processing protein RimM [Acidobacteria bacterium]|nr:MAG: 16S rRNA processing protein RimM [Acidobacteriota bacterium]
MNGSRRARIPPRPLPTSWHGCARKVPPQSESPGIPMNSPILVATIVASRGNRGEVSARCAGGPPERLLKVEEVFLGGAQGGLERVPLLRNWAHKGRWILQFPEVESISQARALVGRRIFLAEEELPVLQEDRFYTFHLVGSTVLHKDGRELGKVKDSQAGQAHDFLVVERCDGLEALVPMVRAIVLEIDTRAGKVIVDPPAGLLEGEPEEVR